MTAGQIATDSANNEAVFVIMMDGNDTAKLMAALFYYCDTFEPENLDCESGVSELLGQLIDLGFEPPDKVDYPKAYREWKEKNRE